MKLPWWRLRRFWPWMLKSTHNDEIELFNRCYNRERELWEERALAAERTIRHLATTVNSFAEGATEPALRERDENAPRVGLALMDDVRAKLEQEQARLREWASKALGVDIDGPAELATERIAEEMYGREMAWRADVLRDLKHYGQPAAHKLLVGLWEIEDQ